VTDPSFALGPAVIVRASAWPIEAIELFGVPALSAAACSAAIDSHAYDAAIAHERALLWQKTAFDEAFLRALVVSNPAFADRVLALSAAASLPPRI
jgi:hypothetical protein